MKRYFTQFVVSLCTLAACMLASCQKELVSPSAIVAHPTAQPQQSTQELLRQMAVDKDVKLLFQEAYDLANEYEVMFINLSPDARREHLKQSAELPNKDYLVRTNEQMTVFFEGHRELIKKVETRYLAYAELNENEGAAFTAKLIDIIIPNGTQNKAGGPCSRGYSACMSGCGDSTCANACWAGLQACLAILYPAP